MPEYYGEDVRMTKLFEALIGIAAFAGTSLASTVTFANFSQEVGLPNVFGFLNYTSSSTTSNGNLSFNDPNNPCGAGNTCHVLTTLSKESETNVSYKVGSTTVTQTQPSITKGAVVPGSIAVSFQYESAAVVSALPIALRGVLDAHMNMTLFTTDPSTTTKINSLNNFYFTEQPLDNGTIAFTLDTPITSGMPGCTVAHPCSNLLTVTATGSGGAPSLSIGLNGHRGTGTTNLNGDAASDGDTIAFSSDFLTFTSQLSNQVAMGFSSIKPCFTTSNALPSDSGTGAVSDCTTGPITAADLSAFLRTFDAAGEGSFATDLAPGLRGTTPEPNATVFGLTGCGLFVLSMRRRRFRFKR